MGDYLIMLREEVVKLSGGSRLAFGILVVASLVMSGCSFTTVTKKYPKPAPGPQISTGLSAVMPQVKDQRSWPNATPAKAIPHVRYFAPQITKTLRKELVDAGLFNSLPQPDDPAAAGLKDRLDISIRQFGLEQTNNNFFALPHLLADGLFLPAFAITTVLSGGRIDMGAYLIPSSTAATNASVSMNYVEELDDADRIILTRTYLIEQELGAVSERQLNQGVSHGGEFGVKVGQEEAAKVMNKLIQSMTRDPYWAYLADYRTLKKAEENAKDSALLEEKIEAANSVMNLLRPLPFTLTEISVVLNSKISYSNRASIINDLRKQRLGEEAVNSAPYSEERIKELFNDPRLMQAKVESGISQRALKVVLTALKPGMTKKQIAEKEEKEAAEKKEGPPPLGAAPAKTPPDPAKAAELRDKLTGDLAARIKGNPQLQALLLAQADIAVGELWKPMAKILDAVDSPQTRAYLKKRNK